MARWGKTLEEDPQWCELGPEIADIEISTICHKGCSFCYKSNTIYGRYMTLETFQKVFVKLPDTITQIAFGIGDLDSNPDMLKIFNYCRENNVVPNLTINGYQIVPKIAKDLANLCGAIAVSNYDHTVCLNAVEMLSDAGLNQVNVHYMLAKETLSNLYDFLQIEDSRKKKINAIVLLSLKKCGRGSKYTQLNQKEFNNLIEKAAIWDIPLGFDSCSAHKYMNAVRGTQHEAMAQIYAEPCESGLFSIYINVDAYVSPCSFTENNTFKLNLLGDIDFLNNIWLSSEMKEWRNRLWSNNRECPLYRI